MSGFAASVLALLLASQQSAPYVSAAELDAFRERARADNRVDQLVKDAVVDGHRIAVAFLRRVKPETNALVHDHVTEMYQIVQGSGVLVTGGSLKGAKPTDLTRLAAGLSRSGGHEGGQSQKIGVGDIVIIPAGTPHRFSELSGEIIYLVYRFDSQKQ